MCLHVVTNGKMRVEEFIEIATAINSYVDFFHIREKQLTSRELYIYGELLLDSGIQPNKVIINDRVDVALALGIQGVQLAGHSLPVNLVRKFAPNLLIGCSTHHEEEVQLVEREQASYALYGHIFTSSSKPGVQPKGLEDLQTICNRATIPIIAIGGITPDNTELVLETGASGIAVMSGILAAKDPVVAAQQYKASIIRQRRPKSEQHI